MLLWIAVIVPPLADKVFLTDSCTHTSSQRLKYYLYNDTVGMETTVRCILLNVSQIYVHSSKYLSIADCQERHPFVCEVSSDCKYTFITYLFSHIEYTCKYIVFAKTMDKRTNCVLSSSAVDRGFKPRSYKI